MPQLVYILAISVLTLIAYAQQWNHEFINFDDGTYVSENPHVRSGLTLNNMLWAFSRNSVQGSANWHPLTWWSLMLDAEVYGDFAGGFRMTNLVLHLASTVLLLRILTITTQQTHASAFVATVFAIHPLHVESVAWIAERKDTLSVFFGFLAIWQYVRFLQTGNWRQQFVSQSAFAFSLMSKQMLVTLPCVLLLLDYWPLQRWPFQTRQSMTGGAMKDELDRAAVSKHSEQVRPGSISRLMKEKAGYVALSILFSIVAFLSQSDGSAVGSLSQFPMGQRLQNALSVYAIYIWQTFFPRNLAVFYPYPVDNLWIQALSGAIVLGAISVWVIRERIRRPYLATGWFWFLGTLVPVIGIVQIGMQRMADRYMYFPMVGLLIMITWLVRDACSCRQGLRRTARITAIAISFALTFLCWKQVSHWKDTESLFSHAVSAAESSLSQNKLGYEFASNGDVTRASNCFHRALLLDPNYTFAHVSLGNIYLAEGRFRDAEVHFRKATEISPDYDEAQYNLGIALVSQNQPKEAISHFRKAIAIAPEDAQAHINLGIALSMSGNIEAGIQSIETGLILNPKSPEAHFNLAQMYAAIGQNEQAVQHLLTVTDSNPDLVPASQRVAACLQLAELYTQLENAAKAEEYRELAQQLQATLQTVPRQHD